jgi:hypothetical protein
MTVVLVFAPVARMTKQAQVPVVAATAVAAVVTVSAYDTSSSSSVDDSSKAVVLSICIAVSTHISWKPLP